MTAGPTLSATGLRAAEAVAGFGLPERDGDDVRTLPGQPLVPSEWARLLATCRTERTIGLLVDAIASGQLSVTDDQAAQAESAHAAAMTRVVLLEQVLVAASARLTAAGVGHRVLKGSASAWLDWPDPALRSFSDVDLLLADDHESGLRALEAGGCRRSSIEVHRGFDRRFGKGTTMVDPTGHELDVHRTLAAGAYGLLIRRHELLEGGQGLVIGGRQLLALARPQRLVHACYHAALGDVRPRHASLRDVGELVLRSEPHDRGRALELAASWDGSAPVAAAISTAARLLGLPSAHPLVRWALAYEPTANEQRRLRAYCGAGRSFAAQAIEGWRVLPTISDRLAYAAQLVLADRHHLRARGESNGRRLVKGARIAARMVRP